MSELPGSPAAARLSSPSWRDARLLLGVLLVLVSVVVGARVLGSADRTDLVWTAARDLAPGTTLAAEDLRATPVRLLDAAAQYLPASETAYVGYVLDRELTAGELVPVAALDRPDVSRDLRFVSVPVLPGHYPDGLAKGQQVDVWATPEQAAGVPADGASAELVLEAVTVQSGPKSGSALEAGGTQRSVLLAVSRHDVAALVAAMSRGRIDLVRVPEPVAALPQTERVAAEVDE